MSKVTAEVKDVARDYRQQMEAIEKAKECAGAQVAKLALPGVQKDFEARRQDATAKVSANPGDPNAINELEAVNKYLDKIEKEIVANNKTIRGCPAPQVAPPPPAQVTNTPPSTTHKP